MDLDDFLEHLTRARLVEHGRYRIYLSEGSDPGDHWIGHVERRTREGYYAYISEARCGPKQEVLDFVVRTVKAARLRTTPAVNPIPY